LNIGSFDHARARFLLGARDLWPGRRSVNGNAPFHLDAAIGWLRAAHDAAGGQGVARSYSLRFQRAHKRDGWLAAYPETTGYIIPTFFDYAALRGIDSDRARAIRMAEWESAVQMPEGAVQGATIDAPPSPAVFNTGQVLFGWTRAYKETRDPRFLESARKASDFLVAAQDPDGAWRRFGSRFARPGVNVYDARSAWGLLEASTITGDPKHESAAIRNLDYVIARQHPNGWFPDCCLDDDRRPLLHTIAYTMEGLVGAGALLGEERFYAAAMKAARALVDRQRPDGGLAGRFDEAWTPTGRWSCLTGDAQTAIVCFRLYEATQDRTWRDAAAKINRFLMSVQPTESPNAGILGGIAGSHPIWGEYAPFEFPNWAAKFFADALMLETRLAEADAPATR
jgi:hypothetical protein